jgi:hypothetical protein
MIDPILVPSKSIGSGERVPTERSLRCAAVPWPTRAQDRCGPLAGHADTDSDILLAMLINGGVK